MTSVVFMDACFRHRGGWSAMAVVVVLGALLAAPAGALTLAGTVTTVLDGDTVKVRSRGFETTVRMIRIDTPEKPPDAAGPALRPAASARLRRLLPVGRPSG